MIDGRRLCMCDHITGMLCRTVHCGLLLGIMAGLVNAASHEISALPVGTYRMQVRSPGFRPYTIKALPTDVARILVQDVSKFTPVLRFGSLGRNVIVGPGFNNSDLSIMKNTKIDEKLRLQFRAELFDVLNHANLGQPGNSLSSPSFGRVTSTRFPTGESGSSRQVQIGIKLIF